MKKSLAVSLCALLASCRNVRRLVLSRSQIFVLRSLLVAPQRGQTPAVNDLMVWNPRFS
jgi:hypothetical protein